MNFKAKYLDVANAGDVMDNGCMPGAGKLIDSSNPTNSLIYAKLVASGDSNVPPCGVKMPEIGSISASDKACILSWINSVIAASK
jgi:hypothetical protein